MPGGDRRGPDGYGPMTGRSAGYCAGYNMPGFMNRSVGGGFRGGGGFGRGGGRGFGRGYGYGGRGFRWNNSFYGAPYAAPPAPAATKEQEMEYLSEQADYLKENLQNITKRIEELEKENKKG
ncbi:MAG: DUF5320 domain-containing protein [Candidatus Krumholzibacteriota bacterium]|nr:DUF5320 domain-containing protein [Candidatus Krumholzibacteriota bacterium]